MRLDIQQTTAQTNHTATKEDLHARFDAVDKRFGGKS
jgi:hypothetical protein